MPVTDSSEAELLPKPLVITRVFDAPRELVFNAWTDPKQMAQWWGPHGFTAPRCELDARPDGAIHIDMKGMDGSTNPMKGVFLEVVRPERLVFKSMAFDDGKGNFALEVVNTVTLVDLNGKTELTLEARVTKAGLEVATALAGQKAGWNQSLDRLYGLLLGSKELLIIHTVDAPRELVWKAYSEADRLALWWGPKGFKMRDVKLDFRPGGVFHYGMSLPKATCRGASWSIAR